MGGKGSGPRITRSDEEKRRQGIFDQRFSEDALAKKVVTGPWLPQIPPPTLKLSEIGRAKYDEWAMMLFAQNKLTMMSQVQAELGAHLFEKIFQLTEAGKKASASDHTQLQRILVSLRIFEDAPTIASPGKTNKFAGCGFSTSRDPAFRLRLPAQARAGKRKRRAAGS